MNRIKAVALLAALASLSASSALGHGGRLNASGCHNDRKNGGYHCHRSPLASKPDVAGMCCQRTRVDGGCDRRYNPVRVRCGELRPSRDDASSSQLSGTPTGGCGRPRHTPTLDVDFARAHGNVAPYSCRAFQSVKDVDIEHIVAWAEARASGLTCDVAQTFVNDPLNIAVAYPTLNRHEKAAKDIAQWQPDHNKCWFADRVRRVKEKYGLSMDLAEGEELDAILASCSGSDFLIECP